MTRVLAFDLETTGLDPETDRIVEFCFIEMDEDLEEQSRWTERVNPGIAIPPETTEVHGIRDEDVADKPPFADFAERIEGLLEGKVLMAYNHGFDMNTLHYELVRAGRKGLRMDHPVIDPYIIFRDHHPHSLAGAVRHYMDEDLLEAHTAEADTAAMVDVFRAQLGAHGLPADPAANTVKRDRRFLDRARRFYEDMDEVVRFGFGKYRHEPVQDHLDYVQWMLGRDFPEDTKNVAAKLVDRFMERAPSPSDRGGAGTPSPAAQRDGSPTHGPGAQNGGIGSADRSEATEPADQPRQSTL